MKVEDISKNTFKTRYDIYEYSVISFGVSNAPSVFMDYMNKKIHPYLDHFVVVFIDDILVYLKSDEGHARYLRVMLKTL